MEKLHQTSVLDKFLSSIETVDLFGQTVSSQIRFKGKKKHQTVIGGLMSLLVIAVMVLGIL